MSLQEIKQLDVQLFDRYEQVAKEFMAYLSTLSGDHYDPANSEVNQRVNKARGMAQALISLLSSLHAYHPPFVLNGTVPPPTVNPGQPPTPPVLPTPPTPPAE